MQTYNGIHVARNYLLSFFKADFAVMRAACRVSHFLFIPGNQISPDFHSKRIQDIFYVDIRGQLRAHATARRFAAGSERTLLARRFAQSGEIDDTSETNLEKDAFPQIDIASLYGRCQKRVRYSYSEVEVPSRGSVGGATRYGAWNWKIDGTESA